MPEDIETPIPDTDSTALVVRPEDPLPGIEQLVMGLLDGLKLTAAQYRFLCLWPTYGFNDAATARACGIIPSTPAAWDSKSPRFKAARRELRKVAGPTLLKSLMTNLVPKTYEVVSKGLDSKDWRERLKAAEHVQRIQEGWQPKPEAVDHDPETIAAIKAFNRAMSDWESAHSHLPTHPPSDPPSLLPPFGPEEE